MRRIVKWLLFAMGVIFAGAVFVGILGATVLFNTLPDPDAEVKIAGVETGVKVTFDKHSVPHIKATTLADAMHVLGYLHARDRIWQMEFLRRVGEGRLSEFLGKPTLETDKFLRTLDMASAARKSYELLLPETKNALEAYANGINAYVNRPTKMFETSLGTEFIVLGHTPEPWEAWNSVLILKVMGLTLSGNMDREIQRLAFTAQGYSPREIDEIVSKSPRDNPPDMPDLRDLYDFGVAGKRRVSEIAPTISESGQFDWPTGQSASNNWVVSGVVTKSGKPVLANDPHLGFTAPSTFYLAHFSWEEAEERRHVIGGTLPGIPFVIAGRNSRVAWGLTTTNLDSQDIFLEKLNPDVEGSYKTEFGWRQLEESEVEIKVSGGEPFKFTRKVSRHGPILPNDFRDIGKYLPAGVLPSLSWTGLAEDDTTIDTLYLNNMSRNVDEALSGMDRSVSPMQSVVFADVDGEIALATPGRLPVRNRANRIKGRAPVPGWLFKYRWEKPIQSADVPRFRDPIEGGFATANAKFFSDDYPHHITYDWAEHFRQARVEDLVFGMTGDHSVETSKRIMRDDYSPALLKMVQLAVRQARTGAGRISDILQALSRWEGRMRRDRAEPLIAIALFRHLHKNIFEDDLGENYQLIERGRVTRVINVLERGTTRDWCNDRNTPRDETCADMIALSVDQTLTELEAMQGRDWRSWEYGKAHVAISEHRPFGSIGALAGFFNIEVPSAGGPYTLHRGQTNFSKEAPYKSRHGGAYRGIYDLSNMNNSIYVISTGQSGNFLSPHYDDLAHLWKDSKFIKMSTDESDYSADNTGTWLFNPQ